MNVLCTMRLTNGRLKKTTGNGLNVIKIMPETAIKFGSYEAAKRVLANFEGHGDARNINSYSKFVAGGLAGMIAQYVAAVGPQATWCCYEFRFSFLLIMSFKIGSASIP